MGGRDDGPRQRLPSISGGSDEERYHERKRPGRDYQNGETQRKHRGDQRSSEHRRRYTDEDRRRRRSRSPARTSITSQRRERSPRQRQRQRDHHSLKHLVVTDNSSKISGEQLYNQAPTKNVGPLPSQAESFSMIKDPSAALSRAEDKPTQEKQKPNFAPTGLLAAASNTLAHADGTSIILKYHEPPEARKPPPRDQWKLFVFKGPDILETIELSLRSCWLVGREVAVADLAAEHPSISKQHAVIQFRWIEKVNDFGDKVGRVRPYLIDLESANGTKLNNEPIPSSRYLELREKDMIQFGDSTREYVLMLPPKD